MSSAATLVGLEAPPAGANLEVKPYAIWTVTTDHVIEPADVNDLDAEVGIDVEVRR